MKSSIWLIFLLQNIFASQVLFTKNDFTSDSAVYADVLGENQIFIQTIPKKNVKNSWPFKKTNLEMLDESGEKKFEIKNLDGKVLATEFFSEPQVYVIYLEDLVLKEDVSYFLVLSIDGKTIYQSKKNENPTTARVDPSAANIFEFPALDPSGVFSNSKRTKDTVFCYSISKKTKELWRVFDSHIIDFIFLKDRIVIGFDNYTLKSFQEKKEVNAFRFKNQSSGIPATLEISSLLKQTDSTLIFTNNTCEDPSKQVFVEFDRNLNQLKTIKSKIYQYNEEVNCDSTRLVFHYGLSRDFFGCLEGDSLLSGKFVGDENNDIHSTWMKNELASITFNDGDLDFKFSPKRDRILVVFKNKIRYFQR